MSAPRRTAPNFALPGFGLTNKVENLAKTALQVRQVRPKELSTIPANLVSRAFGRIPVQAFARPALLDPFPRQVELKCAPSALLDPIPPWDQANAFYVSLEPTTLR